MALPPGQTIQLKGAARGHVSLVCSVKASVVHRYLGDDFEWTDRRLEACLNVESARVRWLLLRLNQEISGSSIGKREMCSAILEQLSVELARYIQSVRESASRGGLAAWRLRLIDDRLAELRGVPTVTELAELCQLSVRQLTRAYRESRGCSLGDHIADIRMEDAKSKLAMGESIKTVAFSTGYSSPSNFISAFRRATGITPKDYQTRIRSTEGSEIFGGLRPATILG